MGPKPVGQVEAKKSTNGDFYVETLKKKKPLPKPGF